MKRYIFNIVMLLVAISSFSCAEMMNDARDTEKVELIEVAYKVDIKDFTAATAFEITGRTGLSHSHSPVMQRYTGLDAGIKRPLRFIPTIIPFI